ncbi:MAG: GNAT family N-acetyltransferase [Bacteroidales bacterium]|jgi:ribosomal-protein-serine acetyltransferase|nr:GNAT family N-acetyltransferase [Bacteroidales bacterium]
MYEPFILKVSDEIILKQLEISDAADIFQTIDNQRKYLGEWLPFVDFTKELKDSQCFINSIVELPEEQREYTFVIKVNGIFAGLIGFKTTDRINRKSEIGYWLSEPFQRKGIMINSVKRLLEFGFVELELNRIQIKTAVGNIKSEKIPLNLGFVFEGIERDGEFSSDQKSVDVKVFSLLRKEYDNIIE